MQVETYEVEVVEQDEMQKLAIEGETIELIESLELTGQQQLMNPETKSIIPYRHITAAERVTFRTLFPNKCDVKTYHAGPIPLRVLQIISHIRSLNMSELAYLEVWYPKQGIDDPVLVGRPSSYSDPVFLLARWGKALLPFEQLQSAAVKLARTSAKAALETCKREVEQALADVVSYCEEKMAGGELPTPHFYR